VNRLSNRLYISVIAAFLALGPWQALYAQEEGAPAFLQNINDIPLMPGLYEMLEEGVVFDKPGGRIAAAEAITDIDQAAEIQSFYSHVLPRMGWVPAGVNAYIREGEVLRIAIEDQGRDRIVHFTVSPQP